MRRDLQQNSMQVQIAKPSLCTHLLEKNRKKNKQSAHIFLSKPWKTFTIFFAIPARCFRLSIAKVNQNVRLGVPWRNRVQSVQQIKGLIGTYGVVKFPFSQIPHGLLIFPGLIRIWKALLGLEMSMVVRPLFYCVFVRVVYVLSQIYLKYVFKRLRNGT